MLVELHNGHPGIVRSKAYARSYVWWPSLDKDIEAACKSCGQCQSTHQLPVGAPSHSWQRPQKPWQRLHLDYAGPIKGKMFLIVVDAHSKWLDVCPSSSSTSAQTVDILRTLFACHGLPETIVSDNGPCFTSEEFDKFCKVNGICHVRSAPYHPASNGLAERAVQTFKSALSRSELPLQKFLPNFLFTYRSTPHATTNVSPAELLFKRQLRSRLDLLRPRAVRDVVSCEESVATRRFALGDEVWASNQDASGTRLGQWSEGLVENRIGNVMYDIRLTDGRLWTRHVDHIRRRTAELVEAHTSGLSQTPLTSPIPPATAAESKPHTNLHERRSCRPPHELHLPVRR